MAADDDLLATKLGSTGYYGVRVETETSAEYELTKKYLPYGRIASERIAPFEVESGTVFTGAEGIIHFSRNSDSPGDDEPLHVVFAFNHPKVSGTHSFVTWAGTDDSIPMTIDEKGLEEFLRIGPPVTMQKDSIMRCGSAVWTVAGTRDNVTVIRVWIGKLPGYVAERLGPRQEYPTCELNYRPICYSYRMEELGKFLNRRLQYMKNEVKLEDVTTDPSKQALHLLRFLLSTGEDIKQAIIEVKAFIAWYVEYDMASRRKKVEEIGMDGVEHWDLIGKTWKGSFFKIYDYESDTQYIIDVPTFDTFVDQSITTDQALGFWFSYLEYRISEMERRSIERGRLTFTTWIIRLKNYADISLSVLNTIRLLVTATSSLYVHHTRQMIIMDAPDSFSTVANTIAGWLPEQCSRKFQILPLDADQETLIEAIAKGEKVRDQIRQTLADFAPIEKKDSGIDVGEA